MKAPTTRNVAGYFITFEGGDGAGKTTQINLLKDFLESKGRKVILSREPGGTVLGERLRRLLLDRDLVEPTAEAELLMMAAARAQHVKLVLQPAIDAGRVVLCDRYSDATWAYQHFGRNLPERMVAAACDMAEQGLRPDLTVLLDVPEQVANHRMASRGEEPTRFEVLGSEFKLRVREGYRELHRREPERILLLDATESVEEIHARLVVELQQRLPSVLAQGS